MDLSLVFSIVMWAAILGGLLYVFKMLPIDATIKQIAYVLILIVVIVWAMRWLIAHVH